MKRIIRALRNIDTVLRSAAREARRQGQPEPSYPLADLRAQLATEPLTRWAADLSVDELAGVLYVAGELGASPAARERECKLLTALKEVQSWTHTPPMTLVQAKNFFAHAAPDSALRARKQNSHHV